MMTTDTIAAIATAPGQGGVGIVRLSGPQAEGILTALFRPARHGSSRLTSHMLTYGHILDGETVVDECMAVVMRAPRSYTREDVAEIQLHGGQLVCQRVLALCLREGARLADPGEFTRRAFLGGRIDLSQAEAVMGLIAARGEQARRAAMAQLQGGPSAFIRQAADELYGIQAGAAACIDYPEEITEEEAAGDLLPRLLRLADTLESACDERAARLLRTGLQAALCGRPNAGKSSLLNALLGEDRAIVTDIPGTTRDVLEGEMQLGGLPVRLTDTAGLRDSDDPVERLGVERARRAIREADAVLLVLDGAAPLTAEDRALAASLPPESTALLVNKSDLPAAFTISEAAALLPGAQVMTVSALDPASLAPVKDFLLRRGALTDALPLTQPRHMEAARRAARHLREAADTLRTATVDLAAVALDAAQLALSEITGDQVDEKLLDRVFSEFCVGK